MAKNSKISEKAKKTDEETEEGKDLDDAFLGDDDVEYAPSKVNKNKGISEDELDSELDMIEKDFTEDRQPIKVEASKPIAGLKKGDKINIDGKSYTVDAHEVLIDHGCTKEMTLELYDDKDKDYQLRYFDDQIESTLEFYELQEILYLKRPFTKVSF